MSFHKTNLLRSFLILKRLGTRSSIFCACMLQAQQLRQEKEILFIFLLGFRLYV